MVKLAVAIFLSFSVSALATQDSAQKLVSLTLKTHQEAINYHAWLESPHHPNQWFTPYVTQGEAFRQELCTALSTQDTENLVLFSDQIATYCTSLATQLDAYLHAKKMKLFKSTASILRNSRRNLGPTIEVIVDTVGGPVFFAGDLKKKELALTFDDGPHKKNTRKLLDILDDQQVTANFFILGNRTLSAPHIVKETQSRDHTVSNHSQNHLNLPKYSSTKGEKEIISGFDSILLAVDKTAPFFRFPYGAKTSHLKSFLKQNDTAAFYWNIDTIDWKIKDPEKLLNHAMREVKKQGRGIVLFHDIQPQTIAMMPAFLERLRLGGYKTVVHRPLEWMQSEVK